MVIYDVEGRQMQVRKPEMEFTKVSCLATPCKSADLFPLAARQEVGLQTLEQRPKHYQRTKSLVSDAHAKRKPQERELHLSIGSRWRCMVVNGCSNGRPRTSYVRDQAQ